MILHLSAAIKDFKVKPDAGDLGTVIQLEAKLDAADIYELARLADKRLQVQLLYQTVEEDDTPQQGGLFDPEPIVRPTTEGSAFFCSRCGEWMDGLVCTECGQRHKAPGSGFGPSSEPREPEPAPTNGHVIDAEFKALPAPRQEASEAENTPEITPEPLDLCVCGHRWGNHQQYPEDGSAGFIYGRCLLTGCSCVAFRMAEAASSQDPAI